MVDQALQQNQPNQPPQKHLHPVIWVTVLVLFATVTGYLFLAKIHHVWPLEEGIYFSRSRCEQKTGKTCVLQGICDAYVPPGKTGKDVCGQDFGWVPSEQVPDGDVSMWQTYRNEELGFEFKYPDWKEVFLNESGLRISNTVYDVGLESLSMRVSLHNSMDERIRELKQSLGSKKYKVIADEILNINGTQSKRLKISSGDTGYRETYVFIPFANGFVEFSTPRLISVSLDQILSTFKFIESEVKANAISVLVPNGGESWKIGKEQTIRWFAPSSISNVSIFLDPYYPPCPKEGSCPAYELLPSYTIRSSLPNTGEYEWIVGNVGQTRSTPRVAPGEYKIRIADSSKNPTSGVIRTEDIFDNSDGPFMLIAAKQ